MTAVGKPNRPIEAVLWMIASGLSFVGVNWIVRYLGPVLPSAQSAFLRFFFGLVFLLPVLPRLWRAGLPQGTGAIFVWRGVAHTAAVLFWFYAMARIPVAHATAIGYLSPVLVLVASALLMGEGMTSRRLVAVGVAFCGALVVLRPGGQEISLGHFAQIGAATFFAISYLFAKRLTGIAPALLIVAMMSVTVTLGLAPIAWVVWVPVTASQMAWLAVVAVLATLGHYLMTRAFAAAPLAVTQPVVFLQLIWASTLGALQFNEPVDIWVLIGGAMIVGAISWSAWSDRRNDPSQDVQGPLSNSQT
jgi:drug/metabolite transporter (DMT)-like permease